VNGIRHGFGAGSASRSGTRSLRSQGRHTVSDEGAIAAARMARAFDALQSAAMGRLRLFYAARIGGLRLIARGDQGAAIAALINERDAALAQLVEAIGESRRVAVRAARRQAGRKARPAFERTRASTREPIRPRGSRIGGAARRPHWSRP
jgi:hypothetical protein